MTGLRAVRWQLLALLTVFAVVATACGSGDDDDTSAASSGEDAGVSDAELDRDAELRIAVTFPPAQFDPHLSRNVITDAAYIFPMYDRLILINGDLTLAPMLASDWTMSEDGLMLDLTLRDDVTFHDGTTFDAEVVKGSLERAQTVEGSTVGGDLEALSEIEVVDPQHVRLHFSEPSHTFPYTLAGLPGAMISPQALTADLAQNPIGGSGGYEMDTSTADSVRYVRNEEYWDPDHALNAALEIRAIPDNNARMNALQSGQVDVVNVRTDQFSEAEDIAATGDYVLDTFDTASVVGFYVNTGRPPLDNPEVRQALSFAIDRGAIITSLLDDACTLTVEPFPEGVPGYLPELEETYTYDPEEAERLLAGAGVEDLTLEVVQQDASPAVLLAEAVQDQLGEIGISANLNLHLGPEARTAWRTGNFDLAPISAVPGLEPQGTLERNYLGADNPGGADPELVELADAVAQFPLDSDERVDALEEVNRHLVENLVYIPFCASRVFWLSADYVYDSDDMAYSRQTTGVDPRFMGILATD